MKNAVDFGFVFLAFILFSHAILAVALVLYGWARRKGYRGLGVAAVLLVSAAVAAGLTSAVIPSETPFDDVTTSLVAALLWAITSALIVAFLPRRSARAFGARAIGFPFRLAGWLIAAAGGLLGGTAVVLWARGERSLALAINGAVFAAVCAALGRYLATRGDAPVEPSIADLRAKDRRPPVLYLRSFEMERQPFAIGDGAQYAKYASDFQQFGGLGQTVGIPFEQYMADAVREHLGPFVALGSPEDYLVPHGAVRDYASDADWKEAFGELAREASCILAEFTVSGNLGWELEYLRAHGLQQKLCIVTPPPDQSSGLGGFYVRWMARLRGLTRPIGWDGFKDHLRAAGYQIDFDDPGPGVALSFDQEGKGFVLNAEAVRPDEFIEPIAAWIVSRERIGRTEPIACANCHRTCYVPPAFGSVSSTRCRQCRSPHRELRRGIALALTIVTAITVVMALAYPEDFLPHDSWILDHTWIASAALVVGWFVILMLILPDESPAVPTIPYETPHTLNVSLPARAPSVRSATRRPKEQTTVRTRPKHTIEGKWASVEDQERLHLDSGQFTWTQPSRIVSGRYVESFDRTGLIFKNERERAEARLHRRSDRLTITFRSPASGWLAPPGTYVFRREQASRAGTDGSD